MRALRAVLLAEWLAALAGSAWHHDAALVCIALVATSIASFGLCADTGDLA